MPRIAGRGLDRKKFWTESLDGECQNVGRGQILERALDGGRRFTETKLVAGGGLERDYRRFATKMLGGGWSGVVPSSVPSKYLRAVKETALCDALFEALFSARR